MRFLRVTLQAPPDLPGFYQRELGLDLAHPVGETKLELAPADGEPFYHFAFLVPGDRFEAAFEWAAARTDLLPDRDTGERVFEFEDWVAHACYFEDPAGNIVELVAHRGIGESGATGSFAATELLGLSELGLVGDKAAMAEELERGLGLTMWAGTLTEPDRLAFVGERTRTLILSSPGRGWMPTGRPAEPYPATAVFPTGSATLRDGALVTDGTSA